MVAERATSVFAGVRAVLGEAAAARPRAPHLTMEWPARRRRNMNGATLPGRGSLRDA